jgi:hypothetical protein
MLIPSAPEMRERMGFAPEPPKPERAGAFGVNRKTQFLN